MSQSLQLELTRHERDVLLRGLRHVRSSIMRAVCEPSPEDAEKRERQLREIASLIDQLKAESRKWKVET